MTERMKPLPNEKMWEIYDIVTKNCNNCSDYKKETNKRLTRIETILISISAVGTFVWGTIQFFGEFIKKNLLG